jgi:hypothetical protein
MPLRTLIGCLALAAVLPAPRAYAVNIRGVQFPDTEEVAQQSLAINGVGVRVKVVFDVYAAGLYLPQRQNTAQGVLQSPGAKSVQAVLLRNLTAGEFVDALIKGYRANNPDAEQQRYKDQLEQLETMMTGMKQAPKGSRVRIDLLPGVGTRIYLNGQRMGADIPGEGFYQTLLRIWLGPKPVDDDLKAALLGQP